MAQVRTMSSPTVLGQPPNSSTTDFLYKENASLINDPNDHTFTNNVTNPLEGFKAMVVITGGGAGAAYLTFLDNEAIISPLEGAHDFTIKRPKNNRQTFDVARPPEAGASVRGLIRNFCKELGIQDETVIGKLIKAGKAEVVTNESVSVDDPDKAKLLRETGLFEEEIQGNNATFSFKHEHKEKFVHARKEAILDYAYALGEYAFVALNQTSNAMILTGPLALGIDRVISENPDTFKVKSLEKLITNQMHDFINNVLTNDNDAILAMEKMRRFKIICDKNKFNIKNNTEGGKILFNKSTKVIRGQWRGNIVKVPLDVLKKNSEKP
jgi:hypothetical protein